MKCCICCGFESDNYRLFIKPPRHRWSSEELFHGRTDGWICRSEKKCIIRSKPKIDINDPYSGKDNLGAMIRSAAVAAIHSPCDPDLIRINNILACEAFLTILTEAGCMITRIPHA